MRGERRLSPLPNLLLLSRRLAGVHRPNIRRRPASWPPVVSRRYVTAEEKARYRFDSGHFSFRSCFQSRQGELSDAAPVSRCTYSALNRKGPALRKPLISLVGDAGFEPATPAV